MLCAIVRIINIHVKKTIECCLGMWYHKLYFMRKGDKKWISKITINKAVTILLHTVAIIRRRKGAIHLRRSKEAIRRRRRKAIHRHREAIRRRKAIRRRNN